MKIRLAALVALIALLSPLAFAGPPQWVEVRSAHFTVISDAGEKQARHVLDQLERMRWVFQKLFSNVNVDPAEPILVFAGRNTKTFQSAEPAPYLKKGRLNLAGYFLRTQDRNYILLRLDTEEDQHPFATVYHEYTHLQFASAGEWMPLWLNEGIAEFFQNTKIRDKNVSIGQADTNDILYLRQQRLIPLPVLFAVDAKSPYYHEEEKGSMFYAESWAVTHYLEITDREHNTQRLQQYLQLVSHHEDPVKAAEKAFGDLKKMELDLESYIHLSQYKEFLMNSAAAPIDESAYTARSLTQFDADAMRAEILSYVQREDEARQVCETVLKADANNVQARETLGEMEFRAQHLEEARKWFGEAVKLDPRNYLADYYYGLVSIQAGHPDDALIETSLRAAIQSNPAFAPAYERLAAYLGMNHKNMDEAFSLIKTAVKLDPGNFYFRMNAGSVLMGMGKYTDAAATYGAAVKLARNPQQAAMAQTQVDQVQQFLQTRARMEQEQKQQSTVTAQEIRVVPVTATPKHPAEANGPKHTVSGKIKSVTCGYPATLEFELAGAAKTYRVYNNDFTKIDLSALGFTPNTMNPCSDLEGYAAKVQYAESTDSTVDGQVFAIELRK